MDQMVTRRGLLGFAGAAVAVAALPAHTFAATLPTAKLFCTEAGKGRNVMLIHGWTADSHDWSWQLPVLESRYRTVCVDLRGHGRSEVMASGGYMPANYVADLEALIAHRYRGEKFVLIGHSMGAQIAERDDVSRSRTRGRLTSRSMSMQTKRTIKDAALASEIMQLGNREGYLKRATSPRWLRVRFPYTNYALRTRALENPMYCPAGQRG